jgi:plastocyanin
MFSLPSIMCRAHGAPVYRPATLLFGVVAWVLARATLASDLDLNVQDRDGHSLSEVVVLVDSAPGGSPKGQGPANAVVDQLHQQFVPGVVAVRTGTAISFPNSDSISHQVYSFSPAKRFELGLYRGVPRDPVIFDKPGIVVLGCNIHDNMIGYVYVTDAQYFGTTNAEGRFRALVSPGKYRVRIWSPRLSKQDNASEREVDVGLDAHSSLTIQLVAAVRASGSEREARRLRDY